MEYETAGAAASLVLSVAGNLFLGIMFLNALINPSQNTAFIFKTGMLIFLIEFLSIHSSGMAAGLRSKGVHQGTFAYKTSVFGSTFARKNPKIMLIAAYFIFVVAFALIFRNWFVPLFFFVSLVAKFYGNKATQDKLNIGIMILLFIGTVFVVLPFSALFQAFFPIPQEILGQKLPGSSGLFVDVPQTLLAWGILYFFLAIVVEVVLFWKRAIKNYLPQK